MMAITASASSFGITAVSGVVDSGVLAKLSSAVGYGDPRMRQ